jgi:hypothetical protein
MRCAHKMTKRGAVGKDISSIGCRCAEHGQTCTKDRTCDVGLRARAANNRAVPVKGLINTN